MFFMLAVSQIVLAPLGLTHTWIGAHKSATIIGPLSQPYSSVILVASIGIGALLFFAFKHHQQEHSGIRTRIWIFAALCFVYVLDGTMLFPRLMNFVSSSLGIGLDLELLALSTLFVSMALFCIIDADSSGGFETLRGVIWSSLAVGLFVTIAVILLLYGLALFG